MNTAIAGLHRNLMTVDCIYCELMSENRLDEINDMCDEQITDFMKSMKSFLSVLRTEYAYELLVMGNRGRAAELKKKLEKVGESYPYPSEIIAERRLMIIAEEKRKRKENNRK